MDNIKLRRADFFASLLLIAFGIFIIALSMKMPLKASYGGVDSHWYVSPALFPLFVGGMIVILGLALAGTAVRQIGLNAIFARSQERTGYRLSGKSVRTLTVALALGSFIYVFVPRIDFFISIATFLFFLTTVFYPENDRIRRRLTIIFGAETAVFALLAMTGLWKTIYDTYVYTFDILAIFTYIAMVLVSFRTARSEGVDKGKIKRTLWLSIIVPAFLCPVFRYPLRTPLPHEGLIIDYMNVAQFRLRKLIQGPDGS